MFYGLGFLFHPYGVRILSFWVFFPGFYGVEMGNSVLWSSCISIFLPTFGGLALSCLTLESIFCFFCGYPFRYRSCMLNVPTPLSQGGKRRMLFLSDGIEKRCSYAQIVSWFLSKCWARHAILVGDTHESSLAPPDPHSHHSSIFSPCPFH